MTAKGEALSSGLAPPGSEAGWTLNFFFVQILKIHH